MSVIRAVVLVALVVSVAAREVGAHPIHTTLTVIRADRTGRVLTISIRAFADDVSAAVARFAGRTPPADSSLVAAEVQRYLGARFTLTTVDGASLALRSCGATRERAVYWICATAELPRGGSAVRIRNLMLAEVHRDQVNIVQAEDGAGRRSLLFTKDSAPASLAW